jgi:tRNA pseudouridine38-40 synthase
MILTALLIVGFLPLVLSLNVVGVTRYNARVMYDGTRYRGWQQNLEVKTVQNTISDSISQRLSVPIRTVGASRTDCGVHARGQAIHFDIPSQLEFNLDSFQHQMNKMLPHDIRMYNVSAAPTQHFIGQDGIMKTGRWHATASARKKHYSYTFTLSKIQDPIRRSFVTSVGEPLDLNTLRRALKVFEGKHDFSAFTNVARSHKQLNEKPISPWKTIDEIVLNEPNEYGEFRIDMFLHSALYKMLRNIVWSAMTVSFANSKYSTDDITTLLSGGKTRVDNWSLTAPAHGLCLEHVYYDDY